MLDYIRSLDWTPRSVRRDARFIAEAEHRLTSGLRRSPTNEEIADEVDLSSARIQEVREHVAVGLVRSLNRPVSGAESDDRAASLGDLLVDQTVATVDELLGEKELRGYLRDALRLLPDNQRTVIVAYYLEGLPMNDIADLLGVTQSRISQIRSDAVERLRAGLDAQYTDDDPGREPDHETQAPRGRAETRRAEYAENIAASSPWRERLDVDPLVRIA